MQRIDREVAAAHARQPKDFSELAGLCARLNSLIDLALDRDNPDAFHVLAATRRCVRGILDDR